jgi:phosphonate transport system substrate-binding protein
MALNRHKSEPNTQLLLACAAGPASQNAGRYSFAHTPSAMSDQSNRRLACMALAATAFAPAAAWAQPASAPFEIGLLPNLSPRVLMAQYQPLRDFLARELRRPVQVSTAPDWATFQQRALALEYDMTITGAHLARLAQLDRGHQPLVSYVPDIKALMVCAAAKPVRQLADLRGQTIVLSNPQSLVTLRGMQWLAENGLQQGKDFRTIKTPTDDSVGSVVLRGDALAALVSGGEFRALPDATKTQLQVVNNFAEVPGFVALASPKLTASEVQNLRAKLLQFAQSSDEGKAFFAATGFSAMREVPAQLMESMDPYVAATRKLLAPAT